MATEKMRRRRREKKKEVKLGAPEWRWKWLQESQKTALLDCAFQLAKANPSEMIRKANESLPGVPAGFEAQLACYQLDHDRFYPGLKLLPFPEEIRTRCKFCPSRTHRTSECRHLARLECQLCGGKGHRPNYCTKQVDFVSRLFTSFIYRLGPRSRPAAKPSASTSRALSGSAHFDAPWRRIRSRFSKRRSKPARAPCRKRTASR